MDGPPHSKPTIMATTQPPSAPPSMLNELMGSAKIMQHSICPPKPHFTPDQLPDLSGRVVMVTGGNSGIGKEIIKELLKHNAKVYMATRSQEKALATIEELKKETGKEANFLALDLTSLASVRKAAEEFLTKEQALHTLFNNAGVMWTPMDQITADGFDMQFGVNVVGHFFFMQLLMPALLKGVETSPDKHARVVAISSGYAYIGRIDWDTLRAGHPARKKASTEDMYNQSKFGDILVAFELARRYGDQGIVSVALHPGILKTDILRHGNFFQRAVVDTLMYPPPMGAITPLYAGASTEGVNLNGKFLIPWAREVECWNKAAYDQELSGKLWTWLEEQVKPF